MEDEYIIINKTTLLKRIEELRILSNQPEASVYDVDIEGFVLEELEEIIIKSTPLILEIEKSFNKGRFTKEVKVEFTKSEIFDLECEGITYDPNLHYHCNHIYEFKNSEDYISNLNLYKLI